MKQRSVPRWSDAGAQRAAAVGRWRGRLALYAMLCVIGVVLPLSQFLPWVAAHGLNLPLLVRDLFANQISGFFAWDVLLSAPILVLFMALDGAPLSRAQRIVVVLGTCGVGVSLGLPLYLLLREQRIRQGTDGTAPE